MWWLPIAIVIGCCCFLGCFYTVNAGSVALTETFGAVPDLPICSQFGIGY